MLLLLQGKGLEDCLQRRVSLALIIRNIMTKALMFMCVRKHFVLLMALVLKGCRYCNES